MLENDYLKIILDSNLLNFLVILFLVVYFLPKVLKKSLEDKRVLLNKEAVELENQKLGYQEKLSKIESKIDSIKTDADAIVNSAEQAAEVLKKQIIDSAEIEIERMKSLAYREIEDKKKKAYQEVEAYFIEKAVDSVQANFLEKIDKGEDNKHLAAFVSLKSIDYK
jgi:F0F1-type ATP synthase membrane subunit b/b'